MKKIIPLFGLLAIPVIIYGQVGAGGVLTGGGAGSGGGGATTFPLTAPSSAQSAPPYAFSAAPTLGFARISNTSVYLGPTSGVTLGLGDGTSGTNAGIQFTSAVSYGPTVKMGLNGGICWTNSTQGFTSDICLARASANILELSTSDSTVNSDATLQAGFVRVGKTTGGAGAGGLNITVALSGANNPLFTNKLPVIASGFGTSPSVITPNGNAVFTVNVGTGGTATNGVITMDTATTGWECHTNNITASAGHRADNTVQTASTTTSVTIENQTKSTGAAVAWTASDVVRLICQAF